MITIEVFSSPGCGKCGQAKQRLKAIAEEFGTGKVTWREVNILEELDYAVNLGIIATPAIAINQELVFSGLPSAEKLRAAVQKSLAPKAGA